MQNTYGVLSKGVHVDVSMEHLFKFKIMENQTQTHKIVYFENKSQSIKTIYFDSYELAEIWAKENLTKNIYESIQSI